MTYRAQAIEAWVADGETGQPLEGVVVAAHWELEIGQVFNYAAAGQIMVMETVTDQKGRFSFPEWGPKSTPLTFHPLKTHPRLQHRSPHLLLFKPGYRWLGLENTTSNDDSLQKSEWNGKTIKIDRFMGDAKEYAWSLDQLSTSMAYAFRGEDCEWKQTPKILGLLFSEARALRERGVYTGGIPDEASLPKQEKCGSAREFFKGFPR